MSGRTIRVLRAGMLSTVQDLGRTGYATIGVPAGGAADSLALRTGNLLLGNDGGAAAIEITLVGGELLFESDARVVISGGDVEVRVEGEAPGAPRMVDTWSAVELRAGERLIVGRVRRGARAFLCVAGGVDVEAVLGSRSTLLSAGFGGLEGRALRAGDVLPIGESHALTGSTSQVLTLAKLIAAARNAIGCGSIRAIEIATPEHFAREVVERFWQTEFTVSSRSDRVGVRLTESIGPLIGDGRMPSEGMMCGAVQVPPSGEPIVLFVDHPTTGGYPLIACVAEVDLPAIGQLAPGAKIRFERIDLATARSLLAERERLIGDCERATRSAPIGDAPSGSRRGIDLNCDLGERDDATGIAEELALLDYVSSCNIACGGHAGDAESMSRIVVAAVARGVAIGAHPSYPDRAGFGRATMDMPPAELRQSIAEQIGRLVIVAGRYGARVAHVKPHGALYHAAMTRADVAETIALATRDALPLDRDVVLVGLAGAAALATWEKLGFRVVAEAFADRRYGADGSLVPRSQPGALIDDAIECAGQACDLAACGCVRAIDGSLIAIDARTICLHGDAPGCVDRARRIRERLALAGVSVRRA